MRVKALVSLWRARHDAIAARRDALLQICAHTAPGDTATYERILRALEAVQGAFLVNYAVSSIGFYASVLRPEQAAGWVVAAHPYVPSLAALDEALREGGW